MRPLEEDEAWEAGVRVDVQVDGRTEVAVAGLVHMEVAERECSERRKQEIQRDPQGEGLLVKRD
jgi:hypothetical protein